MDINRNQFFLTGLLLLLMGGQFHAAESFVLTPEFTQVLAEQTDHPVAAVSSARQSLNPAAEPIVKKTITPPDWLSWALLAIGAVLVLHSWGMGRPD